MLGAIDLQNQKKRERAKGRATVENNSDQKVKVVFFRFVLTWMRDSETAKEREKMESKKKYEKTCGDGRAETVNRFFDFFSGNESENKRSRPNEFWILGVRTDRAIATPTAPGPCRVHVHFLSFPPAFSLSRIYIFFSPAPIWSLECQKHKLGVKMRSMWQFTGHHFCVWEVNVSKRTEPKEA